MTQWFDRLRFLWEEEVAPPAEVPRSGREAPTGVPRPLRRATRFALIGAVSVSVMAQIVEVRLIAPVDAATMYQQQCVQFCKTQLKNCTASKATCQAQHNSCTNSCGT